MLRPLLGSTPHASFVLMEDRALMQDQFQLWNNISTGEVAPRSWQMFPFSKEGSERLFLIRLRAGKPANRSS